MSGNASHPGSLTLNQLIALNDEMIALSRAGVPLGQGLLHLGHDMPGRLGRWAVELGRRLDGGQPLSQALAAIPDLPPAYAAVVAAGIRSGRLAVALEDLASLLRRSADLRQMVMVSLIYPLIVVALAFQLLIFTMLKTYPVVRAFYVDAVPQGRALLGLDWLSQTVDYWGALVPILAVVVFSIWWQRTRRGWLDRQPVGSRHGSRQRASIANMVHAGRIATLAETLAALVEHQVPLPEAIVLACNASGDRRISQAGIELAGKLERGEQIVASEALRPAPSLLGWLLVTSRSPTQLAVALRRIAAASRENALWMSCWLSVSVPFWLTVALGGLATLGYALVVIWPFANVMLELSQPLVK